MTTRKIREDNPFEDEVVAREWITSVENETGMIRDNELYPFLKSWSNRIKPKKIVEIGSGQGICADKVQIHGSRYIGVEPSQTLVNRAREKYFVPDREFIVGNAYDLPLPDNYTDTVFSVNVWFHIEDLKVASKELARILKPGGTFLVSTGNPNAQGKWESFFRDYKKEGKMLDGKVIVPVNPLSRNVLYLHSLTDITNALKDAGLIIESVKGFGYTQEYKDDGLFINIEGKKPR